MRTLIFIFLMLLAFQKRIGLLTFINFEQKYIVNLTNSSGGQKRKGIGTISNFYHSTFPKHW